MPHEVCVSFDFDNDRPYKSLLEAWSAKPRVDFVCADQTPREIDSTNVGRIKAALTSKIRGATHTLVIVGKYANQPHRSRALIGYKNWINFEVAQSKAAGNRLVAVLLEPGNEWPDELFGAGATWASGFNESAIIQALDRA